MKSLKTLICLGIIGVTTVSNYATIGDNMITSKKCDKVIINPLYHSCYSFKNKISIYLNYTLTKDKVGYIRKRPSFYSDNILKRRDRVYPNSYRKSGYDRGHIRSHASSSWSKESLHSVYSMVNIWGQIPEVNRYSWIKAEKRERKLNKKYGTVEVLNIALVSKNSLVIGKNKVTIPDAFIKMIYVPHAIGENKTECYLFQNTKEEFIQKKTNLLNYKIGCNRLNPLPLP